MSPQSVYTAIILVICANKASALSVGYENTSIPFMFSYNPQLQSSVDPVLELVNGSALPDVVLSWQLQLAIHPLGGARGQLLFQSTFTPPSSLFGEVPGPVSDVTTPASALLAFDSDTVAFTGVIIPEHTARNIIGFSLHASGDVSGGFQVLMAEWDPATSNGSSWFPADASDPIGFDNNASGGAQGFTLLGTVNVSSGTSAGDYNRDGAVGPQDYVQWRNTFSLPANSPGDGADGNQNSVVDAADYVVWRANVGSGQVLGGSALPEPDFVSLSILSALAASSFRFCRRPTGRQFYPYIYARSASTASFPSSEGVFYVTFISAQMRQSREREDRRSATLRPRTSL